MNIARLFKRWMQTQTPVSDILDNEKVKQVLDIVIDEHLPRLSGIIIIGKTNDGDVTWITDGMTYSQFITSLEEVKHEAQHKGLKTGDQVA